LGVAWWAGGSFRAARLVVVASPTARCRGGAAAGAVVEQAASRAAKATHPSMTSGFAFIA
jgi:hypothetical protein